MPAYRREARLRLNGGVGAASRSAMREGATGLKGGCHLGVGIGIGIGIDIPPDETMGTGGGSGIDSDSDPDADGNPEQAMRQHRGKWGRIFTFDSAEKPCRRSLPMPT